MPWLVKFHQPKPPRPPRPELTFDFVEPDNGFLRCYTLDSAGHRTCVLLLPGFDVRGAELVEKAE